MGPSSSGGSLMKTSQNRDEHLHLTCFLYAEKGSVYSDVYDDSKLLQLQATCDGQPSPLYYQKKLVDVYGQTEENSENPPPSTLEDVASCYRAQFSFVGKKTTDIDHIPWKKNRAGWYVSASMLKPFLMYFDDLMAFRFKHSDHEFDKLDSEPKIVLHLPEGDDFNISLDQTADELKCSFEIESYQKVQDLSLTVFDLPPPAFPARITVLGLELVSATTMHAVFGGNTRPFQQGFVSQRIKLRSMKRDPQDAYAEHYRIIGHMTITNTEESVAVLQNVFNLILHSSPVLVRLQDTKFDASHVKQILDKIEEFPNVRVEE